MLQNEKVNDLQISQGDGGKQNRHCNSMTTGDAWIPDFSGTIGKKWISPFYF
jgi:hypothetical protein